MQWSVAAEAQPKQWMLRKWEVVVVVVEVGGKEGNCERGKRIRRSNGWREKID